jgi:antitoxin CptB
MDDDARALRLKRLRIRCWRRGIKEMDMLFGPYADGPAAALDDGALGDFEALLEENDQDLYAWISGARPMPAHVAPALGRVADFHGIARAAS